MHFSHKFLLLLLIAGFTGHLCVCAQESNSAELRKAADEAAETVVRLRGLDFKSPVRKSFRGKGDIEAGLKERVLSQYGREKLKKEEKMLRKLGLVPETIDYGDYVLKLRTAQIESYYDPEKKTLYIASWLPAGEQIPVLIYEFTHALQDQYFDFEEILGGDRTTKNNDRILAYKSLLDGDATVVMLQQKLEAVQRHFSDLPDLSYVLQTLMATSREQYDVFNNAPVYLQQILLFPYGYGASFLQKAWNKTPGWQSINDIYLNPPVSTEQIMHPEKYFDVKDKPVPVSSLDPTARLGGGWQINYQNVMGEFVLGLLLNLHLTEEYSRKAALGWGGDEVMHLENDNGQDAVFVNSTWDTVEDAEKFYQAMGTWFLKRFPDGTRKNETSTGFSLTQDGKFYEIQLRGKNLYFILGLPEEYGRIWQDSRPVADPIAN